MMKTKQIKALFDKVIDNYRIEAYSYISEAANSSDDEAFQQARTEKIINDWKEELNDLLK
jgi:hypothetical protein